MEWSLCTALHRWSWDQKGQTTYCPNVFTTKAILSQSFGVIHSLISQTRTELQCGFGTVLIAEQDSPLKHALPLKPCHKTRIGLMRQYVFQPTHGKNVFTANWTSLHRRKQNLRENSLSQREHCHKLPGGFQHGYHLRFPKGFPHGHRFCCPTKCNYLLQQSHLYHMKK